MNVLETQDLAIGYAASRRPRIVVAQGLNLRLEAGRLVCLLGANGVGKSTLMRTIAAVQKPLAGRVLLAGRDTARLKPRQLASYLSVVLTERPNIGLLNGYALVALGRHPHTDWTGRLSRHDEAVIRWAVEAVGACDVAERPVMELSDGQRQKLMIARALAQEAPLILLDEPTAFLDLPRRAEIMRLLRHLASQTGRAILLSTHDLDLALRSADTLWLMAAGQVCVGAPEDLVISRAFEDAFRSEGVVFDRTTGTFSVQAERRGTAVVHGQGIVHTWTRRALQRSGFALLDEVEGPERHAPPLLHIRLHESAERVQWSVDWGGAEATCSSIGELLAALQQLHGARAARPDFEAAQA
ncbi:MAG: ABC transporter ATP-binding protein [Anaerolineae bacterium]|nr:ABC transporter ATP-binding protein [Anaerolineae bacterium]MDW8171193.1 ABC transporter ATP-binding protein [Anaerolineae bacterium]